MQDAHLPALIRVLTGTRLPALVNLTLIALTAWLLAALTWHLVPAAPAGAAVISNRATGAETGVPRPEYAAEIIRHQLFGTTAPAAVAVTEQPSEAPDTKLNLELRGVLAYDPKSSALAIISESRGDESVYAIGDELPGSATLEEVYADRVILRRNGRLETLRLPENSTPIALASATGSAAESGPVADLTPRELRDTIVKDPMQFARKVRTIPHKENGKLVGYKLRAREYQDVLAQYGLQPNDVITAVNGTALNDPKTSLRALRSLATAREINATILRDGVEMPIFVSLE